jgi:hypothetical protein
VGPNPLLTAASTTAINANTGAIKENLEAHKMFARLQDDEILQLKTFREFLLEETKALQANAAALASGRTYIQDMRIAMGGLMDDLKKTTSLSAVYSRSLEQLSVGTKAYTSTMQAHTGAVGEAREQSTKFVEGMQAAQAQSHELAAQFNMDQATIAAAGEQATKMFATQLLAAGDVAGGIKSIQKEAVIMSRYFGTDMAAVMESWDERMKHSNMTLEEAKDETALLSKVSDDYAKSLGKLGDKMLQTAQMGKKDFLTLFKEINQEFKVGIPNAVAMSTVLSKLTLEAAKGGATKTEQEMARLAQLKFFKEVSTTEGTWGVMAHNAAEGLWQKFQLEPGKFTDKARERMEKQRGDLSELRASGDTLGFNKLLTETLGGTAELIKASLGQMREKTGGNVVAMTHMLQEQGMTFTAARQTAKGVASGDLERTLEENKEALMGQAEQQKTDAEKLVSEGAKTNSTLHNIAQTINQIRSLMIANMIANPVLGALGGAAGGAIMNRLLGGAAGALLPKAAGAILPGAAGFIGPTMPVGAAAMAGVKTFATAALPWLLPAVAVGVTALGAHQMYTASKEAASMRVGGRDVNTADVINKRLGGAFTDENAVGGFLRTGLGKLVQGVGMVTGSTKLAALGSELSGYVSGDAGWKTKEFVMDISFKELQKRKDKIKLLEDEIKQMKSSGKALTEADRRVIEEKQRQADSINKSIAGIKAEENKMKAFTPAEIHRNQLKQMEFMAGKVGKGSARSNAQEFLSGFNPSAFQTSEFGNTLDTFLSSAEGKKLSKASGGEDALRRAMQDEIDIKLNSMAGYDEEKLRGMSSEKLAYLVGKTGGAGALIAPDTEATARERSRGYGKFANQQQSAASDPLGAAAEAAKLKWSPDGKAVATVQVQVAIDGDDWGRGVATGQTRNNNAVG